MSQPKRIAYLIPQFPGQTHQFFWREIAEVEKQGCFVSIFSTRMPPPGLISHAWSEEAIARTHYLFKLKPTQAVLALARIPWGKLGRDLQKEGRSLLRDVILCAPAARNLALQCRAASISHVHVHSCGRSALIAVLAKLMYGLEYSLTLHGPVSDYGNAQPLKWRHARFATLITKKLMAEVQHDLAGHLPEVLRIQPMGVDVENLKRSTAYEAPKSGEPVRIFTCGRLNIVKGHQDLFGAVALLVSQGFNIQLEIAGEDDDGGSGFRKVLEKEIENRKLGEHIQLLGAIDAAGVKEKLLSTHIFALASWHEPLGVAYMEAMSCEVPTLGTASGGVEELITNGEDGYLVQPKSPPALADAIAGIIANPEQSIKIANAGRARVVKSFRSSLGAETILREIEAARV